MTRRTVTVLATGVFDLLHVDHVRLLMHAKELGDHLIVGINSDRSVRRLKGPGRPIIGEEDRVRMLMALYDVDSVVVFDEDTPEALIARVRPDFYVKGADYLGKPVPEREQLERQGGRLIILDSGSTTSTSDIINRIKATP